MKIFNAVLSTRWYVKIKRTIKKTFQSRMHQFTLERLLRQINGPYLTIQMDYFLLKVPHTKKNQMK